MAPTKQTVHPSRLHQQPFPRSNPPLSIHAIHRPADATMTRNASLLTNCAMKGKTAKMNPTKGFVAVGYFINFTFVNWNDSQWCIDCVQMKRCATRTWIVRIYVTMRLKVWFVRVQKICIFNPTGWFVLNSIRVHVGVYVHKSVKNGNLITNAFAMLIINWRMMASLAKALVIFLVN